MTDFRRRDRGVQLLRRSLRGAPLNRWITDHKGTLGPTDANELTRHFR